MVAVAGLTAAAAFGSPIHASAGGGCYDEHSGQRIDCQAPVPSEQTPSLFQKAVAVGITSAAVTLGITFGKKIFVDIHRKRHSRNS